MRSARNGGTVSVGSSTDSSDSASESDTLKHLVEEDDDEESEEVFIASDNEGQTDDWTVLGSHVDSQGVKLTKRVEQNTNFHNKNAEDFGR